MRHFIEFNFYLNGFICAKVAIDRSLLVEKTALQTGKIVFLCNNSRSACSNQNSTLVMIFALLLLALFSFAGIMTCRMNRHKNMTFIKIHLRKWHFVC